MIRNISRHQNATTIMCTAPISKCMFVVCSSGHKFDFPLIFLLLRDSSSKTDRTFWIYNLIRAVC